MRIDEIETGQKVVCSGLPRSSEVRLWMQLGGRGTQGLLEPLCAQPSNEGEIGVGAPEEGCESVYARQQSYEEKGSIGESKQVTERDTQSKVTRGQEEYIGSCSEKNVVARQSHERSGNSSSQPKRSSCCSERPNLKGGEGVLGVAAEEKLGIQVGECYFRESAGFYQRGEEVDSRAHFGEGQAVDICYSSNSFLEEAGVSLHGGVRDEGRGGEVYGGYDDILDEKGRGSDLAFRSIHSIRRLSRKTKVCNITCLPDHAYIANGIVVHNCAYRMSGYSSNQLFQEVPGESRSARNPRRMIPRDKCMEIVDDCAEMGVKAIQFTGGGEPTVHPHFRDIAYRAQAHSIETALVTNGVMFSKPEFREVALNMSWVRVSVDAGNRDTYAHIRSVSDKQWDLMSNGLAALVKERESYDFRSLYQPLQIGVGFVVTPDNHKEIYQAAEVFSEIGVDNIRYGVMFNPEGDKPYKGIKQAIAYEVERVKYDFHSNSFNVIDRTGEKLKELKQGRPDYRRCGYQELTTYIGGDQNVYRCCIYAYNLHGLLGTIRDKRFKDFWFSEERAEKFREFSARSCERCQFTIINKTINKALDEEYDPPDSEATTMMHVNFV